MADRTSSPECSRSSSGMHASSRRGWLFEFVPEATQWHIQGLFLADAWKFYDAHSKIYQLGCGCLNHCFLFHSIHNFHPSSRLLYTTTISVQFVSPLDDHHNISDTRSRSSTTISEAALDGYSLCQHGAPQQPHEAASPTFWHRHAPDPCPPCSLLDL